jgi:hypothetical protein
MENARLIERTHSFGSYYQATNFEAHVHTCSLERIRDAWDEIVMEFLL